MFNISFNNCTGCSLCASICPQKCISMTLNDEGFYYPTVDKNKCINCDACNQICPTKACNDEREKHYYALQIKNKSILSLCASGGAFASIASTILDLGGSVCGVAQTGNKIEFRLIYKDSDIKPLLNSKYYQCPLSLDIYDLIDKLDVNRPFLFSGTPCQVAAIEKKYRKRFADNLITVELICQGTNSENVVSYFTRDIEKTRNKKVVTHIFRSKDKTVGRNYLNKYIYETGEVEYLVGDSDDLTLSFQNKIFLRESCYNCNFSNHARVADITIGDLWKYNLTASKIDFAQGVSVVVTNSPTGESIIEKTQTVAHVEPVEADAVADNIPFNHAVKRPFTRAFSYKLLNKKLPVKLILFICCTPAYIKRIIKRLAGKKEYCK